jgi:hypothetical protein
MNLRHCSERGFVTRSAFRFSRVLRVTDPRSQTGRFMERAGVRSREPASRRERRVDHTPHPGPLPVEGRGSRVAGGRTEWSLRPRLWLPGPGLGKQIHGRRPSRSSGVASACRRGAGFEPCATGAAHTVALRSTAPAISDRTRERGGEAVRLEANHWFLQSRLRVYELTPGRAGGLF